MNTSVNINDILAELNRDKAKELIPAYIILALLMLFGLSGNTFVLLFTWRKSGRCIASFFILVLALTDTFVCLTIPLVIVELIKTYIFTYDILCQLYVFSKFFTALFSGFVLLAIAVYRYRQICRPLKEQLTLKGARITVISLTFPVLLFSLPEIFFVEIVSMDIPNKYNVTVTGRACTLKEVNDDKLNIFKIILEGIFVLMFVTAFTALIILYFLQAKTVIRLSRNLAQFTFSKDLSKSSASLSASCLSVANPRSPETPASRETATHQTKQQKSLIQDRGVERQGSSTKITIMFFFIALVFFLSFMPYLAYSLWRTFKARPSEVLIPSPLNLFCLNSYLINSVTNPVILGIFHLEFRQYLKRLFCCCRISVR